MQINFDFDKCFVFEDADKGSNDAVALVAFKVPKDFAEIVLKAVVYNENTMSFIDRIYKNEECVRL